MYSQTFLSINPEELAKENGCIEVSLEELYQSNGRSEFKMMPSVNIGKQGEVVNYADLMFILTSYDANTFIHVCQDFNSKKARIANSFAT